MKKGEGTPQDYTEALKWYKRLAETQNADAENAIGKFYDEGHGVQKNSQEAVKLGSGVKARFQGWSGFNLAALASIVSARFSIIDEGLSLSTGRFWGRVSSPGIRNSL